VKDVSDKVYNYFTGITSFSSELGTKLYPLVAKEKEEYPFAVYRIITSEGETKDADKATVTLSMFYDTNQYTECVTFSDTVENLVKNRFNWISTDVDFIEEDQSFVANINFEIT
jgi:hypothetical protein